jgi:CubicO group peptidase (beta-lactamase class C family)
MAWEFGRALPEEVGLSSAGLDRIDEYFQKQIDDRVLVGVSTLVARHGSIVRQTIAGVDNRRTRKPLQPDTIFRLFSMTKPVTGIAMGILRDRGLWTPEDPVAKHLPELANLQVFTGVDDRGRPQFESPEHPPTMLELLTHTAGFGYGLAAKASYVDERITRAKAWKSHDLAEFVERMATVPLHFQPGTRWKYSAGMDLQGAIIERLSGQTLPEFYEQNIFAPLGMVDTGFTIPRTRLASLYFTGKRFRLLRLRRNPLFREGRGVPTLPLGGAGLVSTVEDYARFCQLLLNKGELGGVRIVSAASVEAQLTNHLSDEIIEQRADAGHMHFRPGFGFGYNGAVFYDPGLAQLPVGRGTYMWDGAADTFFWVDPENDLLFVGLTQLLSYSAPALQEATQRLMGDAIMDSDG